MTENHRFAWALAAVLALTGGPVVSAAPRTAASKAEAGAIPAQRLPQIRTRIAEGLARRPDDARLHYLNAALYEHDGAGSLEDASLAEVGYRTAGQLDPAMTQAHLALGRVLAKSGRYAAARDAFAKAALSSPSETGAWLALAVTAYLAQDLATAQAAAERALELAPQGPEAPAVSALLSAAAGRNDEAEAWLGRAQTAGLDLSQTRYLHRRVADWRIAYAAQGAPAPGYAPGFQAPPSGVSQPFPAAQAQAPVAAPSASPGPGAFAPFASPPTFDGTGQDTAYYGPRVLRPLQAQGTARPRMVMVEAAILRTSSEQLSSRGFNLLDGLAVQLDGSVSYTRGPSQTGLADRTTSRILDGKLSISNLRYSLNIANNAGERVEVLARPSLIAMESQPAQFFSGAEITVETEGTYGSGTLVPKPVGVGLSVTPTFLDDRTVMLAVSAERDTVEADLPSGTFQEALRTARNTVTSNVVLRLDQTLVLGGLLDRERNVKDSRTPVLGRIPGLQYAFANRTESTQDRALMIVLTLRDADPAAAAASAQMSPEVQAILARKAPAPVVGDNLAATANALSSAHPYAAFRDSDLLIVPGILTPQPGLEQDLKGLLAF